MEVFVEVLEPFVRITELMGAETWVTISAVRPLLHKLLQKHLPELPSDARLKKEIKKSIREKLEDSYTNAHAFSIINKSCFLNPRFKDLRFLPQEDRDAIVQEIEEEIIALDDSICLDSEEPSTKKPRKDSLMDILCDVIGDDADQCGEHLPVSITDMAHREVLKYIACETEHTEDPLIWWKINGKRFCHLAKLARKYLCIPATSVPSERAFSAAGQIVNQRRACLLPENVNILVFLAANLK